MYGTTQYLDQLAQLVTLLCGNLLVDGVALQEVLFQYLIRPNAECCGILGIDAIAYRKDSVEIIEIGFCGLGFPGYCTVPSSCFHFGNNHIIQKFAGCEDVLKEFRDSRNFCAKQFRNLTLSEPDGIPFDSYIYTGVSLRSLIYYELRIISFHIQR